uniref:Uncharacterized protein n=1 Tax=Setaria digitata TaxID=48799 RepID=A0A915Q4P9_9BILA
MMEFEGQSAQNERDGKDEKLVKEPAPTFNVEETEWVPPPERPVESMEISDAVEETFRELISRSRMIKAPVTASQNILVRAQSEQFHPADVGDLSEQLRNEFKAPQSRTRLLEKMMSRLVKGLFIFQICFYTLKSNFLDKLKFGCEQYLLTPPECWTTQKAAAVEIHVLDWSLRASVAVFGEVIVVSLTHENSLYTTLDA